MPTSTHVLRIDGMHCGSCSMLIDDTVEDLPGVSRSHTELKAARSPCGSTPPAPIPNT
jgi:copper chaperone